MPARRTADVDRTGPVSTPSSPFGRAPPSARLPIYAAMPRMTWRTCSVRLPSACPRVIAPGSVAMSAAAAAVATGTGGLALDGESEPRADTKRTTPAAPRLTRRTAKTASCRLRRRADRCPRARRGPPAGHLGVRRLARLPSRAGRRTLRVREPFAEFASGPRAGQSVRPVRRTRASCQQPARICLMDVRGAEPGSPAPCSGRGARPRAPLERSGPSGRRRCGPAGPGCG